MKVTSKIGIDSIYSVIDCSDKTILFFDNGRVLSVINSTAIGAIQEFSVKDQLVGLFKAKENSWIMLVNQFDGSTILRNIKMNHEGELIMIWDVELDIYHSKYSRNMLFTEGKIHLTIENHYFVIDELNGHVNEHFSLSDHETFLLVYFYGTNKKLTIVQNEIEGEIYIYDFMFYERELKPPSYKIKIDRKKQIFPNSGIITKKNEDSYFNLLLVNGDNNVELLSYNLVKRLDNYQTSKLNISTITSNIKGSILREAMLVQTQSGEIAITLSKSRYNSGFRIIHLFEHKPSYVLQSFTPINNETQCSNIMMFQDEKNNSKYLVIISYNDLTNDLNITTVFNYFQPINKNKISRHNLKIGYLNKSNKIIHGSIQNLIYSGNMGLLLQWNDLSLASIYLHCDSTILICYQPKINNIFENLISSNNEQSYLEYNFLFFSNGNGNSQNKDDINSFDYSTLIDGTYLYDDTKSKPNNVLTGTIMFTVNKQLSIFAYNVDKNQIIWRNDSIRQKRIHPNETRLFIISKTNPELIIIVDQLHVLKIQILSGETISFKSYNESTRLIVSAPRFTLKEQTINPLLILLDKDNQILKLLDYENNVYKKAQTHFYFIFEPNTIKCYRLMSELYSELHWQFMFNSGETILLYSIPECIDCKSFPVIVSEEYNIINRFDYPYLLGVITNRKKLLIFNSINGNLIYSSLLPETFESPHKLEIFQNTVLITSYHSVHKIPVFTIIELYQFVKEKQYSGINMLNKLIFLISRRKNVDESKIYPERSIHIQQTSFLYNYEFPIDHLVFSVTSESITPKLILFGNERSNVIEGIPERLFTTRRPNKDNKNNIIHSHLPVYHGIIPNRIKIPTKFGSRRVFSFADDIYESKSRFISIGPNSLDTFVLNPNTSFDHIPNDYNYNITISTLISIVTITVIAVFISRRNKLKKWA
ncbi:signal peptide plus transmembrane domain or GPI anchor [Cryptosporidium canis]|uniref:ER membrane protein complex subunit 1 n=1 Tax=Cryptosporidium canis TaxID=195482 RepID=A0A9D5DNC6_9CRYT|nr:signal peptide plus transmembrane domain or GPI anchor [Cryptosporidium canis]